jgi:hypothetical protein
MKQNRYPPPTPRIEMSETKFADYLRRMVSPEGRTLSTSEAGECVYLHLEDPEDFPWKEQPDCSVHGMTVEPKSLEKQSEWIPEAMRVLRPGAHLVLVSVPGEPTGHTGACLAEEAGFEVRDCMVVLESGDHDSAHYVPKAAVSERELGLDSMKAVMYAMSGGATNAIESAEREGEETTEYGGKGSVGLNRVSMRRNFHPTVKPVGIMVELLKSVERKGLVVDPFMGSGTTGIACLKTDHDFLGIEREAEYFPISKERVKHWATLEDPMKQVEVLVEGGEAVGPREETKPVSFLEALGI